ncbi:type I methionyl aminopeptidase [Candidatus Gracilibacteria bacterium]|nr:type I methionyl aminopeptidase [Candidatus Gracilibacteria bacterium]
MLNEKELQILRENGKIHTDIFQAIKQFIQIGTRASEVDALALKMCQEYGVLSAFTGVYNYKYTLQTSVNDIVVHGRPLDTIIFKEGDVVTIDFGVKDKKYGICTDAAFTMIVGKDKHPKKEQFLEVGKKALKKGLKEARAGKRVGDIGFAIQTYVEKSGYHIIKDLTGHGIGKGLHEEPYIYNYGAPGTGALLKAGMTLCIEPILGYSSGEIIDKGNWEIYVADGSIGCQYEHTILITDEEPEIIV